MRLVTQPIAQGAVQLADRDAGVGNFDLDVVTPIVAIGICRADRIRFLLHAREPVEQLARDNLAVQAARRQIRRHGKGFDDEFVVMRGGPDGAAERRYDADQNKGNRQLEGEFQRFARIFEAKRQPRQGAFLEQLLRLQAHEPRLFAQEHARVLSDGWIVARRIERQSQRRRSRIVPGAVAILVVFSVHRVRIPSKLSI